MKKLDSFCRKNGDSKSLVIELALARLFSAPGALRGLLGKDRGFRVLGERTVFELARMLGVSEGEAAELAFPDKEEREAQALEDYEEDKEEEIARYLYEKFEKPHMEQMVALAKKELEKKKGKK